MEDTENGKSFEINEYEMCLRRLADAADLCGACTDSRMATRIMAGIRDPETKNKLLALSPFPTTQAAVNLCRSEESARANEKVLSGQSGISSIQATQSGRNSSSDANPCGACGRSQHPAGRICLAIGKMCHICGEPNHFAPKCPTKSSKPRPPGGSGRPHHEYDGGGDKTDGCAAPKTKMARICIVNGKAKHRNRRTPFIAVEILDGNGLSARSFANVTPDPGAEVSVGGLDFLSAIGLSESDLSSSSFDLVMADKSAPLLSIGQRDVRIRYGEQAATITVVICPEIRGVLLSWLDCIALRILHSDYPLPLPRLPASVQTVTTPVSRPTNAFYRSTGIQCMIDPEMINQL
ncbi:hypothetical protein DAPPUDRAFT_261497 [Daphnia pulex]|uniref:CCHC-type domain-containing protein n=1 Tax=Daphnia pulex TaxID=6669 RepID=E9HL45_DAPPU|nr:hypothetical protein DAPPUDRAFT_261497 [Daphnia pulex]|eukprot:EFX67542.1 hypothetical protein DAPPUDRAFT_261497 [Daphnia pulex]